MMESESRTASRLSPSPPPPAAAVFSVEVDAFLISCLNNPKDRSFVLTVDEQLSRLVSLALRVSSSGSTGAPPAYPCLTVDFPPLSSYHRRIVHRMAEHYGLAHRVFDVDPLQSHHVALLPPHSTSKYRHVQVLVHPHLPLRAPESLLRLRDLLLPPMSQTSSPATTPTPTSPVAPLHAPSPSISAASPLMRAPRRSESPQPAVSVPAAPAAVADPVVPLPISTPTAAAPVRLLMRKPEASPASPSISPSASPLPTSDSRAIAQRESLRGHTSSKPESVPSQRVNDVDPEAIPLSDTQEHLQDDTNDDDDDDDDGEEHMDERLRLQLRARKEEYAKARARIFGAVMSSEEGNFMASPKPIAFLPVVEGPPE